MQRGLSDHRYEQFWRTMTCELTGDAPPVPVEYGDYFREYWNFLGSKTIGISARHPSSAPDSGYPNPDSAACALIESGLSNWASKRRFCTTSGGRLTSIPPMTQKGDLICISYGSDVPYVLRAQTGSNYIIVGKCYVNDVMHGDALSGYFLNEALSNSLKSSKAWV